MKSMIAFFVIIGVACSLADVNDDLRTIDSIYPEQDCSRVGGSCTIAEDCPKDQQVEERGLCPKQRSRGVECCYGVSVKETRCRKRGGECMENCRREFKEASDCPESTVCCILL
ncbi:unnamed protein product [Arctia plantaginis]|uniref:Uncharacterized protein n=1 Tax=Arctia plantaginis TaxID=874455 RepID=A0A8S1B8Z8_ARCPL|nr:unnamed protein product [Arctia plantaginis]